MNVHSTQSFWSLLFGYQSKRKPLKTTGFDPFLLLPTVFFRCLFWPRPISLRFSSKILPWLKNPSYVEHAVRWFSFESATAADKKCSPHKDCWKSWQACQISGFCMHVCCWYGGYRSKSIPPLQTTRSLGTYCSLPNRFSCLFRLFDPAFACPESTTSGAALGLGTCNSSAAAQLRSFRPVETPSWSCENPSHGELGIQANRSKNGALYEK